MKYSSPLPSGSFHRKAYRTRTSIPVNHIIQPYGLVYHPLFTPPILARPSSSSMFYSSVSSSFSVFASTVSPTPLSLVADNLIPSLRVSVYPYRYFSTNNAASSVSTVSTTVSSSSSSSSSSVVSSSSSTPMMASASNVPVSSSTPGNDTTGNKAGNVSSSSSSAATASPVSSSPSKPIKSDWHYILRGGALLALVGIPLAIIHEIRYDEEIREWFEDHYPQEVEQIRQYRSYLSLFDIPYAFPREYLRVHQQQSVNAAECIPGNHQPPETMIPLYLVTMEEQRNNHKSSNDTVIMEQVTVNVPGTTKLNTFLQEYKTKNTNKRIVTVSSASSSSYVLSRSSSSLSSSNRPPLSSYFILPSPIVLQYPFYHRFTLESLNSLKQYMQNKQDEIQQTKNNLQFLLNSSLALLNPRIQTLQARIRTLEQDLQNLRYQEQHFTKNYYQPDPLTYPRRKSPISTFASSSVGWLWSTKNDTATNNNDDNNTLSTISIEQEFPYYSDEESMKDEETLSLFTLSPVYRIIFHPTERETIMNRIETFYLPQPSKPIQGPTTTTTTTTISHSTATTGTTTYTSTVNGAVTTDGNNSSNQDNSITGMITKFFKF